MGDWKREAIRLRTEENKPWAEIVEQFRGQFPELSREQLRKKLSDILRVDRSIKDSAPTHKVTSTAEYKETEQYNGLTGEVTSDKLIQICEGVPITPDVILRAHNMDPTMWEVISYRNNRWHSQVHHSRADEHGERLVMYQSRLTARPRRDLITLEGIEKFFHEKDFSFYKPPVVPAQYSQYGEVLEIDFADLHVGLLASVRETGSAYDLKIARELFMRAIFDAMARCKGRKFKKIIVALLGDLLHIDNGGQTTTKGTFQQSDGPIEGIFEVTLDMLIEAITFLGGIAPVEIIYTRGNHDGNAGWMLIKSVEAAFRSDPNITVDVEPNPLKWRMVGPTLIGLAHGNMPEKNLSGWLQVVARNLDRPVRFVEVHSGHRHTLKTRERIQTDDNEGVIIRTMPIIPSSSAWGHEQGYAGGTRSTMSFVWNEHTGLREMWFCNV